MEKSSLATINIVLLLTLAATISARESMQNA